MNWIRVARGMKDDPRLFTLAETCRVRLAEAVGLVVNVLVELPDHAATGDLSTVPAPSLEAWARWHGRPGVFDRAFRETLCEGGVVRAWEKHNGAALRASADARDRMRRLRGERSGVREPFAERSPNGSQNDGEDVRRTFASTVRNGTERTTNQHSTRVREALTPHGVTALDAICRGHPQPGHLEAEVAAILDGMRPNVSTDPVVVSQALSDLCVAGGPVSARALRAFVQSAAKELAKASTAQAPDAQETGLAWLEAEERRLADLMAKEAP